jgi:hypothetical protein
MLYRTFFANTTEDDQTVAGLATHMALVTLNKYFKQFKPTHLVMAFDRTSWRKAYTASDACISKKAYKGNRRQGMSPAQQLKFERFLGHLREFESLITNHSTVITLAQDHLEADDLIAGFVQSNREDKITIITADTDMLQLLKHDNVTIVSPATDKAQHLAEFFDDPEYYVFQKCIRGDSTDNVQSAFPRVRATKIKAAYDDPFELVQLLKNTWTDEDKRTFLVEDLFKENQLLINLEMQPANIRELIDLTLEDASEKQREFSMFHFMRYLGKYDLKKVAASFEQYLPMLSR